MIDVAFLYWLPDGNKQKLEMITGKSIEDLQEYMDELKKEGCKIITARFLGAEFDPYKYSKIEEIR